MKSQCTRKIMSRETKLGCICNRTVFFSNNCTVKLLDEICEQEINIQHLKYSASHTVSHSQRSSLWVKSPVAVWEVIGIWFWICFWAKSFETFFVLKYGITMNFMTNHFPNDHISCSETFSSASVTASTLQPRILCNTFHLQWKHYFMGTDCETGLKEMCSSDPKQRLGGCIISTAELFWFWVWISFRRRGDGNCIEICLTNTSC